MANKEQKAFAQEYMTAHPEVKKMYLNPIGEFFTDESYAINSLPKGKDGKRVGKIETIEKGTDKKEPSDKKDDESNPKE